MFSRKKAAALLREKGRDLETGKSHKVRLLLSKNGSMAVESAVIKAGKSSPGQAAISKIRMDQHDRLLKHKTTNRQVYDCEFARYSAKGYADVIFFNDRGELTEAHSSNVFVEKDGVFYTPPVKCGLLPGTYRGMLLEKDNNKYREKVLYMKDLKSADKIWICNSVRGMRQVCL